MGLSSFVIGRSDAIAHNNLFRLALANPTALSVNAWYLGQFIAWMYGALTKGSCLRRSSPFLMTRLRLHRSALQTSHSRACMSPQVYMPCLFMDGHRSSIGSMQRALPHDGCLVSSMYDPTSYVEYPCTKLYMDHDCLPSRHPLRNVLSHGSLQRCSRVSSRTCVSESSPRDQNMAKDRCTPWSCLRYGFVNNGVCCTGGSCHQSPKTPKFIPPKGRSTPSGLTL